VANRLTKREEELLIRSGVLAPGQAGLRTNLGRPSPKKKRGPAFKVPDEPPDMERRPHGSIIASGCVVGRAVPWKAPDIGANGGAIPTPDYNRFRDWKDTVRAFAKVEMIGRRPYGHPVRLELTFYIRPGGNSPDLTNCVKAFEDGLQKAIFANDRQVKGQSSEIIETEDEPERVEYVVTAR
jgi:Holliday junction resolvase RusA-like endonuclease